MVLMRFRTSREQMNERRKTGTLQKENTRENPYRRFDRFHFSPGANEPSFEIFKCELELYPAALFPETFYHLRSLLPYWD